MNNFQAPDERDTHHSNISSPAATVRAGETLISAVHPYRYDVAPQSDSKDWRDMPQIKCTCTHVPVPNQKGVQLRFLYERLSLTIYLDGMCRECGCRVQEAPNPVVSTQTAPLVRGNVAAAGIDVSAVSGDRVRNDSSNPSPSRHHPLNTNQWIPESLLEYNLHCDESKQSAPVPLPPVTPGLGGGQTEERDSYSSNVSKRPYHPQDWIGTLPGPAPRGSDP
jgi:hypothetical protein